MTSDLLKTIKSSIKHWYIPLIIGLIFIVVGFYTMVSPLASYLALSVLFSLSFLIAGLSEIFFSISNRDEIDNWGWTLTLGILTLLVGILLLVHPEISIATLPFVVGFLILFRSINAIGYAMDLKNYGVSDWKTLTILGVLGIIFSFILLWNPTFAGLTVVIWTGLAFISIGIFGIYVSFRLKKLKSLSGEIPQELNQKLEEIKREIQNKRGQ